MSTKAFTAITALASLAAACQSASAASAVPPPSAAPPVASSPSQLQSLRLHAEGMACDKCSARLREALRKLDGLIEVEADHQRQEVVVRYDPARLGPERIKHEIKRCGFDIVG